MSTSSKPFIKEGPLFYNRLIILLPQKFPEIQLIFHIISQIFDLNSHQTISLTAVNDSNKKIKELLEKLVNQDFSSEDSNTLLTHINLIKYKLLDSSEFYKSFFIEIESILNF